MIAKLLDWWQQEQQRRVVMIIGWMVPILDIGKCRSTCFLIHAPCCTHIVRAGSCRVFYYCFIFGLGAICWLMDALDVEGEEIELYSFD